MLRPAILYKEQIERQFANIMYSEDAFFFNGYSHACTVPKIECDDGKYCYALIDGQTVVGYLTFTISTYDNSVHGISFISFFGGNSITKLTVANDIKNIFKHWLKTYRRIEWRCIEGNPVSKVYDRICKRYGGYKSTLHKCVKDTYGNYRDSYIYEIISSEG